MNASVARGLRLAVLALLPLPAFCGCSTLMTAAYLLQPADVPAEFNGLRGKHVAVVCRPIVELEFTDAGSARELASLVGSQLEGKVRRARVISQQEVARWIDENSWVDYPTLGKSLDADLVVGVDRHRPCVLADHVRHLPGRVRCDHAEGAARGAAGILGIRRMPGAFRIGR